jgi:hypothetical protein
LCLAQYFEPVRGEFLHGPPDAVVAAHSFFVPITATAAGRLRIGPVPPFPFFARARTVRIARAFFAPVFRAALRLAAV